MPKFFLDRYEVYADIKKNYRRSWVVGLKIQRLIFLGLVLFCLFWLSSFGLETSAKIEPFIIKSWRTEDGLPQNSVSAILQSRNGYIWLGTQEGLVRFDGVRFSLFDKNNTKGLISHHILSLYEDRDGVIWIGTFDGGLHSFKHGIVQSYLSKEKLPATIVRCIFQDEQGVLWIGTEAKGLWTFSNGIFKHFDLPTDQKNITIRAINEDSNKHIWIGTEGAGLFRLNEESIEHFSVANGLLDDNVYAICEDNKKAMWIGTGKGLFKYSDGIFERTKKTQGLSEDLIRTVCKDSGGAIWIGTRRFGLYKFYDGEVYRWNISDNEFPISIIAEDKEKNLWVGTNGGGLYQLRSGKVNVYSTKQGLSNDVVWTVACDHAGGIWLGTSSGLTYYANGIFKALNNITSNMIWALCPSEKNGLWIGTSGDGLIQLFEGKITKFKNKLLNKTVWAIQEDKKGCVWIGTPNGLYALDNGKIINYTVKDGLPSNLVYVLLLDKDETLWLGTKEGLCKMTGGQFEVYSKSNGLSNNVVVSLYKDEEGSLWIGTYGGGLNRLKDGKIKAFTKKDGLFDDTVFQIIEDNNGSLWLSSNKGISSVPKEELDDFANSKIKTISCKSFGTSDGLISSECNGGSQPAGCIGTDGRIWFPTVKGVAVIDPNNLPINKVIPPVIIEDTYINGVIADLMSTMKFGPGRGDLEFHYTALSFVAPEKVLFKYKLEGFDKDWVNVDTRRVAFYTNIPPGKYTFKVIACNNDGIWNNIGDSFAFTLKPYFYQTLWFRLVVIIAVTFSGFLMFLIFYKVRIRIMMAESEVLAERNRLAQEIHDTIGQGLQGIIILLQIAERKIAASSEGVGEEIKKACWLARETLQEARHSVLSLHSNAKRYDSFPIYLRSKIEPIVLDTDVDFVFESTGIPSPLSAIAEFNIMRIVQEAVRNAVKHGSPNSVKVAVRYEERAIKVTVMDDGAGFNPEAQRMDEESGFGLVGMRERAKHIGADLNIRSMPGEGTVVEISFKRLKGE